MKLTVSSVRVKKFCATTEFDAKKAHSSGFKPPYTLDEGLARTLEFEFVHPREDDIQLVNDVEKFWLRSIGSGGLSMIWLSI